MTSEEQSLQERQIVAVDHEEASLRLPRRFWELSTDLLCTAGFDGYFKHLNPAWEATLGWTLEELVSQPFIEFVHPEDRERTEAEAEKLTRVGHQTLSFENRYRHKDGTYHTVLWSAASIPEEALIYAIAKDVSDRKRAEEELIDSERFAGEARAQAEQANRAKSEFLSRMSHELRTPLNAVIGFAQLLELDDVDPRQQEGIEQILKASRHLLELINEVLDISRIESGAMSISLESVHLGSVLADVLSLIRPLADEADVRLIGDPAERADLYVRADHQRLKQVLINLLSNAVKYNRRGGEIGVRCEVLHEGRVAVRIADTGKGMTAEMLERLFAPFDRLGAERTDIEGTGLGLALSKGLIEAMGGTIEAESAPEVGTTMRVELDCVLEADVEAASRRGSAQPLNGSLRGTIVYVDDNPSNVKLIERLIERLPEVRLIPAMQGQIGLDLAREHHPDLILLDLHLPDLHGREVLQQLKGHATTAEIPVVIISADATPSEVERLKAAGAAEYLTKPIDVGCLLKTLTRMLRRRRR
jgi:PAS domain S-box-containing protein